MLSNGRIIFVKVQCRFMQVGELDVLPVSRTVDQSLSPMAGKTKILSSEPWAEETCAHDVVAHVVSKLLNKGDEHNLSEVS